MSLNKNLLMISAERHQFYQAIQVLHLLKKNKLPSLNQLPNKLTKQLGKNSMVDQLLLKSKKHLQLSQ